MPAEPGRVANEDRTDLHRAAALLLARPPRLGRIRLVAVDGPSGSGKTVFATALADTLRAGGHSVELFSTDLLATWTERFGWWNRLRVGVLVPLAAGRSGSVAINEWVAGRPVLGPMVEVEPADVLIVEGVSAGRAVVAGLLSALIWVEVPDRAERLERAVARDGEGSRSDLIAWQRAESRHFAGEATRARADLRIDPAHMPIDPAHLNPA